MIWQLDKGKKRAAWKTLNHSVIHILEQAYQEKKKDIKLKDLSVSNSTSAQLWPHFQGHAGV